MLIIAKQGILEVLYCTFMSEETTAPETGNNDAVIKQLQQEIELLKKKNREVVEEKQKIASNAKNVATLPEGESVEALVKFKQQIEQERLEEKANILKH